MNAAELDLRGGHPAVDFVNTVAWRGDSRRRIDYLGDYTDLSTWCRHAGVLTAAEARSLVFDGSAARRVLMRAKRLREALHTVLTAGVQPDAVFGQTYIAAMRRMQLRRTGDVVTWTEPELSVQT